MKVQFQIKGPNDTSQEHIAEQGAGATACKKGKFFLMISEAFSSVSERDSGKKASHPSLSSRKTSSK